MGKKSHFGKSSISFKSTVTTEFKSLALGIATVGLDLDIEYLLYKSHSSTTILINFTEILNYNQEGTNNLTSKQFICVSLLVFYLGGIFRLYCSK